MFKSLMFLTALCSGVGMPVAFETANNTEEFINFEYQNKKMVYYDDEGYTITLTADELNTYTWSNLNTLFVDWENSHLTGMYYNDDPIIEFFYEGESFKGDDEYWYVEFSYGSDFITFNDTNDCKWNYFLDSEGENVPFEYSVSFYSQNDYYSSIKQAIELDIQANSGSAMGNVLTELVSLLVGGIVPFATGLGQGVSDLVSYTFIDNGSLSVFGAMIAVFGGIALAVGLSRWVMNFLTSLGAKK